MILSLVFASQAALSFVACDEEKSQAQTTQHYKISLPQTTGGKITADKSEVEFGGEVKFTATPDENYRLKYFAVNGYEVALYENAYTEYGIAENLIVTAEFEYALVTVNFVTGTTETIAAKTVTKQESFGELPTPQAIDGQAGKKFVGWYTAENGGGELKKASSRVNTSGDSLTLYAHFATPQSVDVSTIDPADYTPYSLTVTYYDAAATELGVTYHTELKCPTPVIELVEGTTDDFSENNVTRIACETSMIYNDYRYTAVLSDLKAGAAYSVRVGDVETGIYGEVKHFTAKDEVSTDLNFMYVADTQETNLQDMEGENVTYWSKTVDEATKFFPASETAFMAHGGDIVNYGVEKAYWREMLGSMEEYMFDMPLVQAPGNHEDKTYYGAGVDNLMYNMYNIDLPKQDYSNGYYYSFDMGTLHFVVLNTNETVATNSLYDSIREDGVVSGGGRLKSEQINWLKNDLQKAKQAQDEGKTKWTVVMMHEGVVIPTYGSNLSIAHSVVLRRQLMETLDLYDVDLVLNAHNHYVQTTNPLLYDEDGAVDITAVSAYDGENEKKNYATKVRLVKIATQEYTWNAGVSGYADTPLVDFGTTYHSGVGGTIFHQVATTGMQYKDLFKESELESNLALYNGLYNNLRSGGAGANTNDVKAYSMFAYIEIKGDQLVLRNYGVNTGTTYSPERKPLKYFGGFIVRK